MSASQTDSSSNDSRDNLFANGIESGGGDSGGDSGPDTADGIEDVSSTLYFGNLHAFVQQKSLEDLCAYFGQVESVKVIKDKASGSCAGYGFVRFTERRSAEAALQALNGKGYLGQELRVNWALPNNHKEDTSHHYHVFVGDLGSDVTDAVLYNTFCIVGQCSDARVMWDHATGRSKGYGFVSFRSKEDAEAAIDRMQGRQIGSRRIRVGWAQHKQDETSNPLEFDAVDRADPSNTNVYIGNVSPETTEADVRTHFSVYGPLAEVKVHKKGGYGFVKFEQHRSAVQAIVGSHGRELHGRVLKCAWGKNTSRNAAYQGAVSPALNLVAALQSSRLRGPSDVLSANAMNAVNTQGVINSLAAMSVNNPAPFNGSLSLPPMFAPGNNATLMHPSLDPNSLALFPAQMAAVMMMQAGLSQQNQQDALQSLTSALVSAQPTGIDTYSNGFYGSMYHGSANGLPSNFN